MDLEKRKRFIINISFIAVILALSILLVRYALPALVPFVIALVVSLLLKPIINFLHEKCHISKNISAVIIVFLFYGIIGLLVILVLFELVHSIVSAVGQLPEFYRSTVDPTFSYLVNEITGLVEAFDESLADSFREEMSQVSSSIYSSITSFSAKILSFAGSTAMSVTKTLLNIIITVVSTMFLSIDWTYIKSFFLKQLSEEKQTLLRSVTTNLGKILRKYIFSYALIMIITFLELFIGLEIVGIKSAVIIAAIIAVFDILPIVGSGIVMFPWAIITLITGNIPQGIGLLILWAVVIIVRYIMEPKIVGDSVGMHPLLTLFAMLLGNFLYGGVGILLLPVTLALLQCLNREGVVHIYTPLDEGSAASGNLISNLFDRIFDGLKAKLRKKK